MRHAAAVRRVDPWESGWLELEGLHYSYRVRRHPEPEFEPTLFVSGAFQTMDSWARFARAFEPHTTILLIDPPGIGPSDVLAPEFGADFLAACLLHLLDRVEIDRVNVVAASYGTPPAFRLGQLQPERLNRVALVGTMKEIPPHVRNSVRETIETALRGERELLAQQVIDGLLCRDPSLPVDRRELAERVLRSSLTRMSGVDLEQYATNTKRLIQHEPLDVAHRIEGPEGLVFTGEHDCFTIPEDCREIAGAFERGWFTTVRRADHLVHIEQFAVVITLLLRFMSGKLGQSIEGCGTLTRVGDRGLRPQHRDCCPVS